MRGKMRNPNVQKVLDLSTAHMPESSPYFGELRSAEHVYGWIVWVIDFREDPAQPNFPKWLEPIMLMALAEDCMLIHFDRDAAKIEGLQEYDW